jgi:protein-disulfide isomerase
MPRSSFKAVLTASFFAVLSLALGGASCDKKSVANPSEPGPSVPFEAPGGAAASKPVAKAPASAPAAPDPNGRLDGLLAKLPSPCGKAMSLKRTLEADPGCARAPFAKKIVVKLLGLEAPDEEITQYYTARYGQGEPATFELRDTPFVGSPNAPVVLVEYYDYACPHCREAAPLLEEAVAGHGKDVVLYFKHFPLHKESMDTAKAAIAAFRQGKFEAMHKKLFASQGSQSRDEVYGYAKELGLDMAKFDKDFKDPATEARIKADKEEGEKTNLAGTPTVFVNGRMYVGGVTADGLADWIDEELAVNR